MLGNLKRYLHFMLGIGAFVFGSTIFAADQNLVSSMIFSKEALWTGSSRGLVKWDTESFSCEFITASNKLTHNDIRDLKLNKSGELWIATYGGGINVYKNKSWKYYSSENGLPSDKVTCLAFDNNGMCWAGTDKGLAQYTGSEWVVHTMKQGLVSNKIQALAIDSKNSVWVGTDEGITRYDAKEYLNYDMSDGLISNNVQVIYVDNSDNLWIGCGFYNEAEGGINMFNRSSSWKRYQQDEGLSFNDVWAIAIDDKGNRWVGTSSGISKYDLREWTSYTTSEGLISDNIRSIAFDKKGNLWVGAEGCITMFDGINWITYKTQ